MNKTKETKLIKAIQEQLPEIMGLKFGCKVKTEEWCNNQLVVLTILKKRWIQEKIKTNKNREFETEWVFEMSDGQLIGKEEMNYKKEYPNGLEYNTEILGRDITALDILKTANKKDGFGGIAISGVGEFLLWSGINECWENTEIYYNTDELLHLQSQQTKDFIGKLLIKK